MHVNDAYTGWLGLLHSEI